MTSEELCIRSSLGLSPWSYKNLNSYSSTKDSLLNTKAGLRNPHIEIWKDGKWNQVEEERRGKSGVQCHRQMQTGAYWGLRRGEESGCCLHSWAQRIKEILWTLIKQWVLHFHCYVCDITTRKHSIVKSSFSILIVIRLFTDKIQNWQRAISCIMGHIDTLSYNNLLAVL